MHFGKKWAVMLAAAGFVLAASGYSAFDVFGSVLPAQQPQPAAQAKPIGTIQTINGNDIRLKSDAGPLFSVALQDSTRFLRIEPGEKDLKNASPVKLQDLQVGDRILVMGKTSADGQTVEATAVVVMKKADVESKQEHDRQDWQRRGIGGLVSAVDAGAGTITISTTSLAGTKTVAIHTTKDTILRRYAPDSVNFDDAKPTTLDQVKVGDQVRARGTRSADGNELAAEEVVAGSFRNIAGTISSVDAAANTLSVADLATKKPVLVKITPESQVRKMPAQMAQFIAARLKSGSSGAGAAGANGAAATANGGGAGRGGRREAGAGGDLQQMLGRVPAATITDLQKGDAVMIVSTEGSASGAVTAITVLGGVEPLLQASPGAQSMVLPPWSLDAPGGDAP